MTGVVQRRRDLGLAEGDRLVDRDARGLPHAQHRRQTVPQDDRRLGRDDGVVLAEQTPRSA